MPRPAQLVQGNAFTTREAPALSQQLLDARKIAVDLFASIETQGRLCCLRHMDRVLCTFTCFATFDRQVYT